jgi:3-oxoacyl-[acyl-carrier-protein] synthase-3
VIPLFIESMGMALPPTVEDAEELAPKIGRSARWIRERAGVEKRHISHESMPVLAAKAAHKALENSEERPDLILSASGVAHQVLPDNSVFLQKAMGFSGIPSFSIHATCLSFMTALQAASGLINTQAYRRILVVSADLGSRGRNFHEPESAALLGDGAAAALLTAPPKASASGLLAFEMTTLPEGAEYTAVRGGGTRLHPEDPNTKSEDNFFHMKGPSVFKMALREAPTVIDRCLKNAGVSKKDLALVVPHQASGFGVEVYRRYGFSNEQVVDLVAQQGNCVAASIPMALTTSIQQGLLQRGDLFMLVGTGAGLSIASAILRY